MPFALEDFDSNYQYYQHMTYYICSEVLYFLTFVSILGEEVDAILTDAWGNEEPMLRA